MKGSRVLALIARLRRPLLWAAGAVIVFTVVFGDLPGEGRYIEVLQDSCHAPAFAALTLIMLTLLTRGAPDTNIRTLLVQGAMTVAAMALLGAATELLQGMLGRDAELDDTISDVAGSIAASSLWLYARLRRTGQPHRLGRTVALLAFAGVFAYWTAPMVRCVSAYRHRDGRFPVLARFDSARDLYFVDREGLDDRIVDVPSGLPAGPTNTALRVVLDRRRWPGITFFELVPDWRGYHTLTLDLDNPEGRALQLHLRVNDRLHHGDFDDRFNTILQLPAHSHQRYAIPLERLASAPASRRMDMSRIATLILFHDGSAPGETFLVRQIALEQ